MTKSIISKHVEKFEKYLEKVKTRKELNKKNGIMSFKADFQ